MTHAPTEPSVKWIIAAGFALIIGSLASALVFLIRDRGRTRNTMRALGLRVGLSIALFLFILFAHWMGWIQSTGVPIATR
ncbi:MAG: twin transmembrane helix small protein [Burkholderiaceae bacterium]|nr:twin transmembrane helix small protein [Burkholderiaceae bacterium]